MLGHGMMLITTEMTGFKKRVYRRVPVAEGVESNVWKALRKKL